MLGLKIMENEIVMTLQFLRLSAVVWCFRALYKAQFQWRNNWNTFIRARDELWEGQDL